MSPLLLDTCALLWLARSESMDTVALAAIAAAGDDGRLYVSAVSAWELGLLWRRRGYAFDPDPVVWLARVVAESRIRLTPLTANQAVASALLPGELHEDPADRLLVATARDLGAALVTRDARLLTYATGGHLDVLTC